MSGPTPVTAENRIRPHNDMTGDELAQWRLQQPGSHKIRNRIEPRLGWNQRQAGEWYGVTERQWRRYETGEQPIPRPLINRMRTYRASLDEIVTRIFDTPKTKVDEWGGVHEMFKHDSENPNRVPTPEGD